MSDKGVIVTKEDLRRLVQDENIRPEDIFSPEALRQTTDKARAEGYADARVEAIRDSSRRTPPKSSDDDGIEDPGEMDKYLDPTKNPFIKLDD